MKQSDARSLARNLALDRDGVVAGGSGGTANIDVTRILNDHISWYGAMQSDRSKSYAATSTSFSIGTSGFSARLSLTTILKILAVTRESTDSGTAGTPVEIVLPADIYHARSKSTTSGTPTMVAFVRLGGASNRLRAICHPPADGTTHFAVHCWLAEPEFTVSSIDDTEVMDYPQHAQYAIVRETALDIAMILRRPDSVWEAIKERVEPARDLTDTMRQRDFDISAPKDEPR